MKEEQPRSYFDFVKVFSKLYQTFYCSKEHSVDPSALPHTQTDESDVPHHCHSQSQTPAVRAEEGDTRGPDATHSTQDIQLKDDWFRAVEEQRLDKIMALLKEGADINWLDQHGWSALHIAAWNNYMDICQAVVTSGADINLAGMSGSTPVSLAAQRGNTDIVSMLLQLNCDLSLAARLADSEGVTPLHLAAQYGHTHIVRLLVDAGAVVNTVMSSREVKGVTPLHLAVQNEHLEIMDILIAAGCDIESSTQHVQAQGGATPTADSKVLESTC